MTDAQLLYKLIAALQQWKCPACGGKGTYMDRGWRPSDGGQIFVNQTVQCTKCAGNGLHPTATEALKNAEEVTND